MNIFLIPYNWFRHCQVALVTGSFAVLAWWALLSWFSLMGPIWPQSWDGPIYLAAIAAATAGGSIFAEGGLRRRPAGRWVLTTAGAAAISGALAFAMASLWGVASRSLFPMVAEEPELLSLSFQLGAWVVTGFAIAIGPIAMRKGDQIVLQVGAGLASGLAGAAVWHRFEYYWTFDLYLSGAMGALAVGLTFGLLAWGIPDALYTGWIRVLSGERYGRRVPIDAPDGSARERFVGHFPRGLDLWLRNTDAQPDAQGVVGTRGVQELHVSVAVDTQHRFVARGLSIRPTRVLRFLEKVDLHYDPSRPAPLETRIHSGDRIQIGAGDDMTELEFLMLPREES